MRNSQVLINLLLLAGPVSCAGTDVGNGFVDIDVALYDSGTPAAAHGAAVRGLRGPALVNEAWVSVERLRLRDASNCEGNSELEFVGPFAIDMLAPGVPDALSGLQVPYSSYCRFELRWDSLDQQTAPEAPTELVGASILIEGTRDDGTRFVLRSERGDELRLDARDGAFSIADATTALFVAFDVQDLFQGVDLADAEVGPGDVIRIEDGSNEDLLSQFDDNLARAAKLFDDDDGDSELDPEERDDADVLAD